MLDRLRVLLRHNFGCTKNTRAALHTHLYTNARQSSLILLDLVRTFQSPLELPNLHWLLGATHQEENRVFVETAKHRCGREQSEQ